MLSDEVICGSGRCGSVHVAGQRHEAGTKRNFAMPARRHDPGDALLSCGMAGWPPRCATAEGPAGDYGFTSNTLDQTQVRRSGSQRNKSAVIWTETQVSMR
jgi:hypothetical protein